MKPFRLISCLLLASILLSIFATGTSTKALPVPCPDVTFIFARGSGETMSDSNAEKFRIQIETRLKVSSITSAFYELGSKSWGGHQYPAVDIKNVFNGNAIGAKLTSGYGNDYGRSVSEGVEELKQYLADRAQGCPAMRFVLAGYSQGAQVVGQALWKLHPDNLKRIDFAALFGDPKLHLPEGYGLFPPACGAKEYSLWRRTVTNCRTSSGSLDARKPYLPKEMEHKAGLWCLSNDFICGSSIWPWDSGGHKLYAMPNSSIDKAVLEIASILGRTIQKKPDPKPKPNPSPPLPIPQPTPTPETTNLAIDTRPILDAPGADVVFLIDTSFNIRLRHAEMMQTLYPLIEKVVASGGRTASLPTETWLRPKNGVAFSTSPFMTEIEISSFEYTGKEWNRAADFKNAIDFLQRTTSWKPGVKRIIIPVTFNEYAPAIILAAYKKQPASIRLTTTSQADDTVLVYPLAPPASAPSFRTLSVPGMRTVVFDTSSIEEMSSRIANQFDAQVIAELRNTDYQAAPGQTLYFDASQSQVYHDEITKYEWDFNGDGAYDHATTSPTVSHTYTDNFSGEMKLRVTTKGGLQSTSKATVAISDKKEIILAPPKSLAVTKTSETTAKLSWQLPDENLGEVWQISINDFPSGYLPKDQTFADITDLNFHEDITFAIRAMSPRYRGESIAITLKTAQNEAKFEPLRSAENTPLAPTSGDGTLAPSLNMAALPHLFLQKAKELGWLSWAIFGLVGVILAGLVAAGFAFNKWRRKHTV